MALNFETAVRMLAFLQENSPVELSVVAKVFELSERDVRKYCTLLNEAKRGEEWGELVEVEIQDDEDGVWIELFTSQGIDRQIRYTAEESLAILGGLHYLEAMSELVDASQLQSLIIKMEQALGPTEEVIQIETSDAAPEVVQTFKKAIAESVCIDLEYGGASRQQVTQRRIEPQALLAVEGVLYARGYCHASEGLRTFRLDRVLQANITSEPATGESDSESDIVISNTPITVRLRMLPEMLESFAPESVIERRVSGDRLEVTAQIAAESWLVHLVLASSGDTEILEPVDLRKQVQLKAQTWLDNYSG